MAVQIQTAENERCRVCLLVQKDGVSLYNSIRIDEETIQLSALLVICTNIKFSNDDLKPKTICNSCVERAKMTYKFKILCEMSDVILQNELNQIHNDHMHSTNSTESNRDNIFDKQMIEDIALSATKQLQTSMVDNLKQEYIDDYEETVENAIGFPEIVPEKDRTCNDCGKVYQGRRTMLKHKKKHGTPTKKCVHCNYIPETPAMLAKHMEAEHENKKNIVCAQCGKRFFKQKNLRLHLIVHTGVKQYTCEVCGLSFALSCNLNAHKRLHTGEKPYTCTECGKSFTQQATLRAHEASHSTKKDHVCAQCGAAFSRVGALRNHQKRHLTERPYKCPMCDQAFAFSSERKRHMAIHTGAKNYKCEVCLKRFNRNTNLKVHMRIHTGETPHTCHICGKGYIQAHCLRSHLNTHNEIIKYC